MTEGVEGNCLATLICWWRWKGVDLMRSIFSLVLVCVGVLKGTPLTLRRIKVDVLFLPLAWWYLNSGTGAVEARE